VSIYLIVPKSEKAKEYDWWSEKISYDDGKKEANGPSEPLRSFPLALLQPLPPRVNTYP
jgi:hypothetical protein